MRHVHANRANASAVDGGNLYPDADPTRGWSEFSKRMQSLDLIRLDPDARRFTHRIIDSAFGDLLIRRAGSDGGAMRCVRSRSRIATFQEDLIWICLVTRGVMDIAQHGAPQTLNEGDLVLFDADQPYELALPGSEVDTLWIGSPRHLADAHIWDTDSLVGRRIDGASGGGRLASQVIRAVFEPCPPQDFEASSRIARSLLDILGAATASYHVEAARSSYRAATARRIKAFIEANLSDETLNVASVAKHLKLSPRYLSKVFEEEAETVAGWIWTRRLERCRSALATAQAEESISAIAYAHGFKNASHFSRAFRKRYGTSPRSMARTALDAGLGQTAATAPGRG